MKQFVLILEQNFGKGELEITVENFDCCGMKHSLTNLGYELDQIDYIKALKPINNEQLTQGNDEDPADSANANFCPWLWRWHLR